MAEPSSRAAAKRYVDRIIEVQRRHGHSPTVTPEQYEGAVLEATRAFERLNTAASRLLKKPQAGSESGH